ncbi:MAG: YkgJ family cysteine cluster protein [Candidatus Heimdallarchaeota archaeon]|nr:YkgJ family cysteine cluster protein [Candidatus Heimdallarchaeota archaeon]
MIKKPSIEICRTNCGSKCCRSTPPGLTSEDIKIIKEKTVDEDWILNIGTHKKPIFVVSKKGDTKDCYFLTKKGLCSIYNHRPLDCKFFPVFLKLKKKNENEYSVRWLIWYCPLTEQLGTEELRYQTKEMVVQMLKNNPKTIHEYQQVMYETGGYKRKHFLLEEDIIISKSDT